MLDLHSVSEWSSSLLGGADTSSHAIKAFDELSFGNMHSLRYGCLEMIKVT